MASLLLAASVLLLGGMAAELQRTASLPLWNRMQAGLESERWGLLFRLGLKVESR